MDAVIRVMVQQDKIFKLPGANRSLNMKWATDRITQHDAGYGTTALQPRGQLALMQGASPTQIASEVTKVDGFALIGFAMNGTDKTKSWGHAVATHVEGTIVEFFDPNYGEYMFYRKNLFHTWFERSLIIPMYGVHNLDMGEIQHFS